MFIFLCCVCCVYVSVIYTCVHIYSNLQLSERALLVYWYWHSLRVRRSRVTRESPHLHSIQVSTRPAPRRRCVFVVVPPCLIRFLYCTVSSAIYIVHSVFAFHCSNQPYTHTHTARHTFVHCSDGVRVCWPPTKQTVAARLPALQQVRWASQQSHAHTHIPHITRHSLVETPTKGIHKYTLIRAEAF